jgi:hypothetical protein
MHQPGEHVPFNFVKALDKMEGEKKAYTVFETRVT